MTPTLHRAPATRWNTSLAAVLAAAAFAVWLPAARNGFVSYDDDRYVTANPHVLAGLGREGVRWAFTSVHDGNWIPLTWVSHMADASLFGARPAGHHLVSVLLHAAAATVLFSVLLAASGRRWPSLAAALLFAVHPLRAESVAWAAERKDVLSGLCALLAVASHLRYAARPSPGRCAATALLLAAGLMAKPMLVSLPVALLVLDWWPLGRLRGGAAAARGWPPRRLVLEKVPLLALSAAAGAVALYAQKIGGGLGQVGLTTAPRQAALAVWSCAAYLGKLLWPIRLAVFYPIPASLPAIEVAVAALLVAGVTAWAFLARTRHPFVAAGWLWYLVTLLPVSGLVPVGAQSMADRYTYLPQIGVVLALVWTAAAKPAPRWWRVAGAAGALLAALALSLAARRQVGHWRSTETLFAHALEVTRDNWLVRNNLAGHLITLGRPGEAFPHLAEALRIRPDHAGALCNIGVVYGQLGDQAQAVEALRRGVALDPGDPACRLNLGVACAAVGDARCVAEQHEALRRIAPDQAARLEIFLRTDGRR